MLHRRLARGQRRRARGTGRTYRRREDQRPSSPGGPLRAVGRHGPGRRAAIRASRGGIGAPTVPRRGAAGRAAVLGNGLRESHARRRRRCPRRPCSRRHGSRAPTRSFERSRRAIGPSSSGAAAAAETQLSAGQQQLLALARALVHRPAVLLLDEATAAIDSVSDAAFRAALRESVLPAGCAVLTVAHRLSTAVEADRVDRLRQGSDRRRRRSRRARPARRALRRPAGAGGRRLGLAIGSLRTALQLVVAARHLISRW